MKLKDEFVTVLNDSGSVTVSTDTKLFSGMIRGNETAGFINHLRSGPAAASERHSDGGV